MKLKGLWIKCALAFLPFALISCGGSGGGGGGGTGTMSVGLTDASTDAYSAVYVTVNEVQVNLHGPGQDDSGWTTIATPHRTYNLLDLANGVVTGLGEGPLPAGSYNQIRLILGNTPDDSPNILCHPHPFANYVISATDQSIHELKVPSGFESGLKIVCQGKCDVAPNQTTEIILDFDAGASVVVAGNSGNFILKPTIKVAETQSFTLVTGHVVVQATVTPTPIPSVPISNALVSAQIFDPLAADPKDQVRTTSSALTDANGEYQFLVKPGNYNLVAEKPGFTTGAVNFTALAGTTPVQDFALAPAPTGTLSGTVMIAGADAQTFATLSLRQGVMLDNIAETIEVDSLDVLNGATYHDTLTAGSYDVVSSTCGLPTQEATVAVPANGAAILDVTF